MELKLNKCKGKIYRENEELNKNEENEQNY